MNRPINRPINRLGADALVLAAAPDGPLATAGAPADAGLVLSLQGAEVRLGLPNQPPTLWPLSLRVRAGERVALVGANGSGKSTLLRCLHGLQPLSAGQRWAAPELRMAMLFQRPHLLRMRVWRNLAWGLWLQGVAWAQTRERALAALARVGLADLAERNGRGLSGGQQQRVALARAWALRPDVWLLDEPTASLDPHAKREVEALVAEFSAEPAVDGLPSTLIFSSHNLGQVKRLASRVLYLEQGRLLVDLPVQRFFDAAQLAELCPEAHAFVQGEIL